MCCIRCFFNLVVVLLSVAMGLCCLLALLASTRVPLVVYILN